MLGNYVFILLAIAVFIRGAFFEVRKLWKRSKI